MSPRRRLTRFTALFAFVLLLNFAITPAANAVSAPTDCTGYAQPRILLDSQAWWVRGVGQTGKDFGHIHTLLCFPVRQTIRGVVPFDIQLTMHDDPGGKLTGLVIQIGGSGQYVAAKTTFKPPLTCADTCSWWVHLDADTSGFANDGWQEFRIRPKVLESDGNTKVGSTSYQAYLANGKPVSSYRPADFFQGKGWYTGVDYAQARITSPLPSGPIGGNWSVIFACDSSKLPVSGCLVAVDPDFHAGNNGTVLFQRAGAYKGTLVLDTRQFVNGLHKLVIRSDVRASSLGSTESGILGVYFTVSN